MAISPPDAAAAGGDAGLDGGRLLPGIRDHAPGELAGAALRMMEERKLPHWIVVDAGRRPLGLCTCTICGRWNCFEKKRFRGLFLRIASFGCGVLGHQIINHNARSGQFREVTNETFGQCQGEHSCHNFLTWFNGSCCPIKAQDNYDAVITNGRVMDPESGLDAVSQCGILAGRFEPSPQGLSLARPKLMRRFGHTPGIH